MFDQGIVDSYFSCVQVPSSLSDELKLPSARKTKRLDDLVRQACNGEFHMKKYIAKDTEQFLQVDLPSSLFISTLSLSLSSVCRPRSSNMFKRIWMVLTWPFTSHHHRPWLVPVRPMRVPCRYGSVRSISPTAMSSKSVSELHMNVISGIRILPRVERWRKSMTIKKLCNTS